MIAPVSPSTSIGHPGSTPAAWIAARLRSPFIAIWWMLALLFAVTPALAPGVLTTSALLSMLPFAGILAIAAIGQTLVIQQGGLDLSVAGGISLAAAVITKYPNLDGGKLPVAIVFVIALSAAAGLLSGLLITQLRITPLVATLGVNALLIGGVFQYSGGSPTGAPDNLSHFALAKSAGIPNTVIVALIAIFVAAFLIKRTVAGRRFESIGENPGAAHVTGMKVTHYRISAYILGSICYGIAGILVAGFIQTPGTDVGNSYLLPSVAAVVLGGTSLAGGVGSVIASACGAFFITLLDQVVLSMGAKTSAQLLTESGAIAVGMGIRAFSWSAVANRLTPPSGRISTGEPEHAAPPQKGAAEST